VEKGVVCEDDNKTTDMTASLYLRRKSIQSSRYNHCIMLSSQDYAQNTAFVSPETYIHQSQLKGSLEYMCAM
jgi:hypothetical protein